MSKHKHITTAKSGDVTVVRFNEAKIINAASIAEMGDELFALIDQDKCLRLLLNFSDVEFLSSAALNKLIVLDKKMKGAGGKLCLASLKPEIVEVFQITRLNQVFSIHDDQASGLASF